MKTCFSIICIVFLLCSEVYPQDKDIFGDKRIREILSELSIKIGDLETIFLVPENLYIENGDASLALVELGKIQALIKDLEGRVENMEHEMRSQISAIIHLTEELSLMLGVEGKILDLNTNKIMPLHETDTERNSRESISQEGDGFSETNLIEQAELFLKKDNFDSAKRNYEEFIKTYPNSSYLPEVFFKLAETQYKMNEWKNAANAYLESFSLKPKGVFAPRALFGLAISLGALEEFDQACLTIEEVQLRFPRQDSINEKDIIGAKTLLQCP